MNKIKQKKNSNSDNKKMNANIHIFGVINISLDWLHKLHISMMFASESEVTIRNTLYQINIVNEYRNQFYLE